MKKFSICSFLCVLGLWISPVGTGLCYAKSTVFDGVYLHLQLQLDQSADVGSFTGKPDRVTASVSSSPDGLWDYRDASDEDAGMDRKDKREDKISYAAASEVAVVSNARVCNKKTTKVTSNSFSPSARMILQHLLIKPRIGFPHPRILSGIFSSPPYVLFMTYLI